MAVSVGAGVVVFEVVVDVFVVVVEVFVVGLLVDFEVIVVVGAVACVLVDETVVVVDVEVDVVVVGVAVLEDKEVLVGSTVSYLAPPVAVDDEVDAPVGQALPAHVIGVRGGMAKRG